MSNIETKSKIADTDYILNGDYEANWEGHTLRVGNIKVKTGFFKMTNIKIKVRVINGEVFRIFETVKPDRNSFKTTAQILEEFQPYTTTKIKSKKLAHKYASMMIELLDSDFDIKSAKEHYEQVLIDLKE